MSELRDLRKVLPESVVITGKGMLDHYLRQAFGLWEESSADDELIPSLVIHSADVEHSLPDVEVTEKLLESLEITPPEAFVYISSATVYGDKEGELLPEQTENWASDEASRARIHTEHIIWNWCKEHGTVCTILRPAPMFGTDVDGWQRKMFEAVNRGYFYLVRGNEARRSIVLAYDVAQVVKKIYKIGGVYNVADPRARTFKDLAEAMAKNGGLGKSVYRLPLKWARILAAIGDKLPLIGRVMTTGSLDFQLSSLTLDVSALRQAIDYDFFDTVEVIARREKNYPYEDS